MTMPDDLRTRIAAVVRDATGDNYDNGHMADPSILWHELGIPDAIDWPAVADAVIAELGLTRQFLVDGIISDGEPRPWEVPCETRYATEWEPRHATIYLICQNGAVLNLNGEHFPCDREGDHDTHGNVASGAIWCGAGRRSWQ